MGRKNKPLAEHIYLADDDGDITGVAFAKSREGKIRDIDQLWNNMMHLHSFYTFNHKGTLHAEFPNGNLTTSIGPYLQDKNHPKYANKNIQNKIDSITFRGNLEDISQVATLKGVVTQDDCLCILMGFDDFSMTTYQIRLTGSHRHRKENSKSSHTTKHLVSIVEGMELSNAKMPILSAGVANTLNNRGYSLVGLPEGFPSRIIEIYRPDFEHSSIALSDDFGIRFVGNDYFKEKR